MDKPAHEIYAIGTRLRDGRRRTLKATAPLPPRKWGRVEEEGVRSS
jgi:hypothetical protein